jgi:hypothetical protein
MTTLKCIFKSANTQCESCQCVCYRDNIRIDMCAIEKTACSIRRIINYVGHVCDECVMSLSCGERKHVPDINVHHICTFVTHARELLQKCSQLPDCITDIIFSYTSNITANYCIYTNEKRYTTHSFLNNFERDVNTSKYRGICAKWMYERLEKMSDDEIKSKYSYLHKNRTMTDCKSVIKYIFDEYIDLINTRCFDALWILDIQFRNTSSHRNILLVAFNGSGGNLKYST